MIFGTKDARGKNYSNYSSHSHQQKLRGRINTEVKSRDGVHNVGARVSVSKLSGFTS